ncbi:hypothetical protein [Wolbachia endosymbiont of Scaptomyza pallida]|uniref:hypothetical protein n=1 Tax=Wolbachia endosymbiont of Scaptomyza pallida TaxID=375923 RepID=UPI0029083A02|nr:hypothetical protein [Wolbachia endosymbiont of Scaptomyza pallida]MDU8921768.1 hypothetical protein [Wolbachia endosymbiont of Scaptomyza pallida]
MSEEGFFSKYISQPVKKFYNYITGKTEESDDVAGDVHNIAQGRLRVFGYSCTVK